LPELIPNINGGRGYGALEDVLVQYPSDLDPNFAETGLGLFERNGGAKGGFSLTTTGRSLSVRAMENYRIFIEEIDTRLEELGIPRERFAPLVSAYMGALGSTDRDGIPVFSDWRERGKSTLIQKYSE